MVHAIARCQRDRYAHTGVDGRSLGGERIAVCLLAHIEIDFPPCQKHVFVALNHKGEDASWSERFALITWAGAQPHELGKFS